MFSAGSPAGEEREDLLALNEDREARRMDISPQTPQAGYLETGHDPGCLRLVPGAPSRHGQHEDGNCRSVVCSELCGHLQTVFTLSGPGPHVLPQRHFCNNVECLIVHTTRK